MILNNLLILLISYLLGSINTSIIVSKIILGDDIRNHGSKNAGATNALRTLGKKGAIIVVIGDVLKAIIAIVAAKFIANNTNSVYIAGLGAVLGHNFPLYFGFKGGKGIIVSTVAMLFADPLIGVIVVLVSLSIMIISKYVSLGSILGAILFVLLSLIFKQNDTDFIVFAFLLAILAVYMHKANIQRLIKGTENKLSFNKKL